MAKVSNKTIAEVFRGAATRLRLHNTDNEEWDCNRNQRFICRAICAYTGDYLWDSPNSRSDRTNAALEVIHTRMGSTGTLEDWLKENHNVRDRFLTPRKMQAYRHAWLQSLIAEYSK